MSGSSAGDEIAAGCKIIETRVAELRQLFSAIDPSPFHERDLDPRAEEFIVGWAEDLPRDARLALLIHLERAPGRADEATKRTLGSCRLTPATKTTLDSRLRGNDVVSHPAASPRYQLLATSSRNTA